MYTKRIITCIISHQVLAGLFLILTLLFLLPWPVESGSTQFVVPKEVEMSLTTSTKDGKRVAAINISAAVSGSISDGRASGLNVKDQYKGNTLFIEIQGYDFTPSNLPPGSMRLMEILFTHSQLIIPDHWLKQPNDKEIVVILRGHEFRYSVAYSGYQVTLTRLQKESKESIVKLNTRKPGAPLDSRSLDSRSVILWPVDVAVLYIADEISTHPEIDIRQDLIIFAKAQGYLPADEVYLGLPQPEKQRLYIVTKEPLSLPNDSSKLLGTFPSYSRYFNTHVYIRRVLVDLD